MFYLSSTFDPELMRWVIIPLLICLARIIDVTIGTIRIIFVSKGLKYLAPLLGFFEVLIWLMAIGQIMQNLTHIINYLAYATGFAMGTYVGILMENRLAMGMALIRVITRLEASNLIEHLRENGFTVTSIDAQGNHGEVKVFFTILKRKDLKETLKVIREFNPNAFYTIEDIGFVRGGVMTTTPRRRRRFLKMLGLKRM